MHYANIPSAHALAAWAVPVEGIVEARRFANSLGAWLMGSEPALYDTATDALDAARDIPRVCAKCAAPEPTSRRNAWRRVKLGPGGYILCDDCIACEPCPSCTYLALPYQMVDCREYGDGSVDWWCHGCQDEFEHRRKRVTARRRWGG